MGGNVIFGETASVELPADLLERLEKEGRRERKSVARLLAEMLEAREIERIRQQPGRPWNEIKKELGRA